MLFASLPMSVEKSSAGPGRAEVPKKLDRCGVKHEIEALILAVIRGREQKRRSRRGERIRNDRRRTFFGQRVRNRMKTKKFAFGQAQKSARKRKRVRKCMTGKEL
jgi:hypothetical protein